MSQRKCVLSVGLLCVLAVTVAAAAPDGVRPPANAKLGDTWTNPKDGAVMLYVPAGEFLMGSNDGTDDEKPQREVYLDGYWIYKYEVTVAQYRKFCAATGRQMPPALGWGWQDDHPIVNVSWDDAKAYADWSGVALPTEAQWEKAARGTDGRIYPWGNEWDSSKCANSIPPNNLSVPQPVSSYPSGASPYGAQDMAGNVLEWCADWYDDGYYKNAPDRNPAGPASGESRVLRGASWHHVDPDDFRAAIRYFLKPGSRNSVLGGFRCARTLK